LVLPCWPMAQDIWVVVSFGGVLNSTTVGTARGDGFGSRWAPSVITCALYPHFLGCRCQRSRIFNGVSSASEAHVGSDYKKDLGDRELLDYVSDHFGRVLSYPMSDFRGFVIERWGLEPPAGLGGTGLPAPGGSRHSCHRRRPRRPEMTAEGP